MFSFFHRTPEINLDCFTANSSVYATTPIIKASKAIPEWWRKMPSYQPQFRQSEEVPFYVEDNMTVRDCYAFIELYKKGVIVENWCDISIRTENGKFDYWYSGGNKPDLHSRYQLGESFPNHHHIKLVSPWTVRETSGVKFLWLGAEWSLDKHEIKVLPGVINFDIVSEINVNIMFPIRNDIFTLPVGNPLVHLVPLSEKKLKVTNHLVTQQEIDRIMLNSKSLSFYGWRKTIQIMKRNKGRGTCPFHGETND